MDSKGNLLTNDRGKPVLACKFQLMDISEAMTSSLYHGHVQFTNTCITLDGFENIRWLAKILGPEKATRNSDSLAYFGFMS